MKRVGKGLRSSIPRTRFFCRDGQEMMSLYELAISLPCMDKETFSHHVGEGKNDFSNWIGDVFQESRLAKDVSRLNTPELMSRKILQTINRRLP